MRSNDLMWGYFYDVFMFTWLQEAIANELGVDVGYYHHHATSLHVYEPYFDMLEEVKYLENVPLKHGYTVQTMQSQADFLMKMVDNGEFYFRIPTETIYKHGLILQLLIRHEFYKNGFKVIELPNEWEYLEKFFSKWYGNKNDN